MKIILYILFVLLMLPVTVCASVITDGYTGTYIVSDYNLTSTDSINFNQYFNGSNVNLLSVDVIDDAIKTDPYDIDTTGLVGWWNMSDTYNDSSGEGNHGTAHGTDIYHDNGKYNNGTVFNGVDDYINCGTDTSLIFDNNSFTVEAWIYQTTQSASLQILAQRYAGSNIGWFIGVDTNDEIRFKYGSGIERNVQTNTNPIQIDTWYCVAVVHTVGGKDVIYVNGINIKEGTAYIENVSTSTSFFIGQMFGGYEFHGVLDNILMYNRSLSATEVKEHYFDKLQQLQINTTTNTTLSTNWNSSANNPLNVPYGSCDLFNLLKFKVPDTVIQNGITIYDYSSNIQFDTVSHVEYTEDITKITETAIDGTYTLNFTHSAVLNGTGYIEYTATNITMLEAITWDHAILTTDNPNASFSTSLLHYNISTGYIAAGTNYYYLIIQHYSEAQQEIYLYPNSVGSTGQYGKLKTELIYANGFNWSEIFTGTNLTSTQMNYLSTDDTDYMSLDKTAANDGYLFVNFSCDNIGTINYIDVNTVHNRNYTNPVILGLYNFDNGEWENVSYSISDADNIHMTYRIENDNLSKYTILIDGTLSLSVSINTNGDANEDVFIDMIEVYVKHAVHEETQEITNAILYEKLEDMQSNLILLQLVCVLNFVLLIAVRKRRDN